MKSGIYKIVNNRTQDIYVGSASYLNGRFKNHILNLNRNSHPNDKLQNAWNKYGEYVFSFEILLYCEIFELIRYEQFFIDFLLPKYNICKVAGNSIGRKSSEYQKKVASLTHLGNKRPNHVKNKIRQSLLGHMVSEETKKKISLSLKGKPWTESRRLSHDRRVKKYPG